VSKNNGSRSAWTDARLGDLVEPRETRNPSKEGAGEFLYVDIDALDNRRQRIAEPKRLPKDVAPSRARMALREGDVVFSLVRPYLKNIAIVPPELDGSVGSTAYCVLRPKEGVDSRFLFYQLIQDRLIHSIPTYGTSPPAARDEEFLNTRIRLTSPKEQARVADKLDELSSDLDAGVTALERAKANLARYRAAVLKAAVEGKLTEEWRRANPKVEPASKVLERILAARMKRWQGHQLAKYEAKGVRAPKGWKDAYPLPDAPDRHELPTLPPTWVWTTVDALGDVAGGVTKGQRTKARVDRVEVPYLRVANVQNGFLDLGVMKTIPVALADLDRYRLVPGDVLFTEGGDRDKLGRGWVWRGEIDPCIHQNHIFRLRLLTDECVPELVSVHGNTFGRLWFQRAGKQSVNLASVNQTMLKRFPVPLAPVAEQRVIGQRLEQLGSTVQHVEQQLLRASIGAARLRQAILAAAFSGGLVA